MTEHLVMHAREGTSRETDPLQSSELDPRQGTTLPLGVRAVNLSYSMGMMRPLEQVDNFRGTSEMDDMKDSSSNPEGNRNAELFQQAYDTVIESIESAFRADSAELGDRLVAVLENIDVLSGTPYISSAPEFVGLVKAARNNVEQVHSSIASDSSPDLN